MKIHFTPEAETQIRLISKLDTVRTGFTTGIEIGKHMIIENLFNVDFDETNIDKTYAEVLSEKGDKLIGPFFKNRAFFNSDWFRGDLIIKIGSKENECFFYDDGFSGVT
jgi:hypothetical protein